VSEKLQSNYESVLGGAKKMMPRGREKKQGGSKRNKSFFCERYCRNI